MWYKIIVISNTIISKIIIAHLFYCDSIIDDLSASTSATYSPGKQPY